MNINKKSWHYWLYSHTYKERKIPVSTNMCQYVRRLAISIPYIVLVAILSYADWVIEKICKAADGEISVTEEIAIRPWHIIVLAILGYLYYHYTTAMLWISAIVLLIIIGSEINWWAVIIIPVVGWLYYRYITIMLIITALAAVSAIVIFRYSEEMVIAVEYLKAQKQKICPIVEFQENQT